MKLFLCIVGPTLTYMERNLKAGPGEMQDSLKYRKSDWFSKLTATVFVNQWNNSNVIQNNLQRSNHHVCCWGKTYDMSYKTMCS